MALENKVVDMKEDALYEKTSTYGQLILEVLGSRIFTHTDSSYKKVQTHIQSHYFP